MCSSSSFVTLAQIARSQGVKRPVTRSVSALLSCQYRVGRTRVRYCRCHGGNCLAEQSRMSNGTSSALNSEQDLSPWRKRACPPGYPAPQMRRRANCASWSNLLRPGDGLGLTNRLSPPNVFLSSYELWVAEDIPSGTPNMSRELHNCTQQL